MSSSGEVSQYLNDNSPQDGENVVGLDPFKGLQLLTNNVASTNRVQSTAIKWKGSVAKHHIIMLNQDFIPTSLQYQDYTSYIIYLIKEYQSFNILPQVFLNVIHCLSIYYSNINPHKKFVGVILEGGKRRCFFFLTTLNAAYVISTLRLEEKEDKMVEDLRKRAKWDNDYFIYRGHILNDQITQSR
ncbi:uncharacterized protein LOC130818428 [Amaranthus tricolor]|uniref:uncharacterized protein LOC130818428 n=1 Tax=Amaranthus tricolor TaxID=29722 RepID=UPI0025893A09|nr:uncharacterized protein LOC130818428 [Amaranthus tricolor]